MAIHDLKEQIARLPEQPGVYLYYNEKGETLYVGAPRYKAHGASPIKLQSHGDPSEPISFRNIWVRELK